MKPKKPDSNIYNCTGYSPHGWCEPNSDGRNCAFCGRKLIHEHVHVFGGWIGNDNQLGENVPDEDGVIYLYYRECQMMGCHCREYTEFLTPTGERKRTA